MPQRLKLLIAYDGGPFAGWQSQLHRNTVQDRIEAALKRITGEAIRVHGAGRTDTGVHAIGQCAHIDLKALPPERLMIALNALLPPAIRVLRCQRVPGTFHARFSAKGKIYRYRVWTAPVLSPFEHGRAWHVIQPIDLQTMKTVASKFVGTHDFAGFSAQRGQPGTDTVRTIRSVRVNRRGPCLTIEFDGNGFLYKMVRLMVGATVLAAQGKITAEEIVARLKAHRGDKPRLVAPAAGLFLVRIRY